MTTSPQPRQTLDVNSAAPARTTREPSRRASCVTHSGSTASEAATAPDTDVATQTDDTVATLRPSALRANGRWEFVDALRGVAALLVVVQHSSEILGAPSLRVFGHATPLNLGEAGVVLFFLVSGLVIPPSIERHGSLGRFWAKRVFRLYPAYWASLAGCLLLVAAGLFPPPFVATHQPAMGAMWNATMLQSVVGVPSAIGAYWTLPLELLFYVLCSAMLRMRLLKRPMLCLLAGSAAMLTAEIAAAARHGSIPAGRFGLLLSALFGAVVFRWLQDAITRRLLLGSAAAAGSVVALGLWLRFGRFPVAHEIAAPSAQVVLLSWLLAYAIFALAVTMRSRPMPRVLLWIGRISYSVYLWHVPVIVAIGAGMKAYGGRFGDVPRWLPLLIVPGATALVAEVCFRAVELPGMRLGERIVAALGAASDV